MKTILIESKLYSFHNFDKTNLVTNDDGTDTYTCKDCGLRGKRFGLDEHITLIRPSMKKISKCNGKKGVFELTEAPKKEKPIKTDIQVKIIDDTNLKDFRLCKDDVLTTVEYPKEQEQGLDGVWVLSSTHSNPIRLLESEYQVIS